MRYIDIVTAKKGLKNSTKFRVDFETLLVGSNTFDLKKHGPLPLQ